MALIITPEGEVKEYFKNDSLNQSLLKKLIGGLEAYRKAEEDQNNTDDEDKTEKEHFIIGGGVDLMLTGDNGAFFRKYYVSDLETKPSDAEMAIVQYVFASVEGLHESEDQPVNFKELKDHPGLVLDACDELKWQGRWKSDTRIAKIIEIGTNYYEDLKLAFGKQVISKNQYDTIVSITLMLKTHPRTAHLFDREAQARDTLLDFYYQLIIEFNVKGVKCKAMLDLVIVELNEDSTVKRVYPYDVKTMAGPTLNFIQALHRRRYDFQASWYTEGLSQRFGVAKDQIENFQFVVESTSHIGEPLIYQMSDELMHIGQHGRPRLSLMDTDFFNNFEKQKSLYGDIVLNRDIKGWEQLMDEYLWYEKNGWDQDRVIAESKGVLMIDWNGVIPNKDADQEHRDLADIYK